MAEITMTTKSMITINITLVISCLIFSYPCAGHRENVALKKPTEQSSTYYNSYSSYAVDGIKATGAMESHTEASNPQWLLVDLQQVYAITSVVVTNRATNNYFRLYNFSVEMSYEHPSTLPGFPGKTEGSFECIHVTHVVGKGATETFTCPRPLWAHYVRVVKANKEMAHRYLVLVELEVFSESRWKFASIEAARDPPEAVGPTSLESSAIACCRRCIWNNECLYFTFDVHLKVCQLLHTGKYDDMDRTLYKIIQLLP